MIAALVTADQILASQALEDAKSAGGWCWIIGLAQYYLDKGDAYAASNRAESAIDAYRTAWKYAVSSYCGSLR